MYTNMSSPVSANVDIAVRILEKLIESKWHVHLLYAEGDPLTFQNLVRVWNETMAFWALNNKDERLKPKRTVIAYQGTGETSKHSEWWMLRIFQRAQQKKLKLERHSLNDKFTLKSIRIHIQTAAKVIKGKEVIDDFTKELETIRKRISKEELNLLQSHLNFENNTGECSVLFLAKLLYELPEKSTEMGYAVMQDTLCFAFRGTKSSRDLFLDAKLLWAPGYEPAEDRVKEYVAICKSVILENTRCTKICFAGHSLGGLLACLVASNVDTELEKKIMLYNPFFAIGQGEPTADVAFVDRCFLNYV